MTLKKALVSLILLVVLCGAVGTVGVLAYKFAQSQGWINQAAPAPIAADPAAVAPGSPLVYTKEDLELAKKQAAADALKNAPAVAPAAPEVKYVEVAPKAWAPEDFVFTRGKAKTPSNCSQTGMCDNNDEVGGMGFCIYTGSPIDWKAAAFDHSAYNAGLGQATVLAIVNPMTTTHSYTFQAWSGSNSVSCYGLPEGESQSATEEELLKAAQVAVANAYAAMLGADNCTATGCKPDQIGYGLVYLRANDNVEDAATLAYHYDPVSGAKGEKLPNHSDFYGKAKVSDAK